MHERIDIEALLNAYAHGVFPMAESADDPGIHWIRPKMRGVFPLDGFHVSRSLARILRKNHFNIKINTEFSNVMSACANRPQTWINSTIFNAFCELHEEGFAHSVEVFEDKKLIGGVYGLALGGAFFGESMFSHKSNASKIALCHLVARLRHTGFVLFDTQFQNSHLKTLGAIEMPHSEFIKKLEAALELAPDFTAEIPETAIYSLQRKTQIS